ARLDVAGVATAEGRFETAVELLSRLHSLDPLAEDVVEASMRALYLSGRRDAALDLYRRFTEELEAELGLEPLATTRELLEQVSGDRPLSVDRQVLALGRDPRPVQPPGTLCVRVWRAAYTHE